MNEPTDLTAVKAALAASADEQAEAHAAQAAYEQVRDLAAYQLLHDRNVEIRAAKAAGAPLPDILSWGDAQAAADALLATASIQAEAEPVEETTGKRSKKKPAEVASAAPEAQPESN